MLECNRIDISEGIDINEPSGLACECIICHYWVFFRINFRFQTKVYDSCHVIKQKSMSFDEAAVLTVGQNDYILNFWSMTDGKAVSRMKYSDWIVKREQLW